MELRKLIAVVVLLFSGCAELRGALDSVPGFPSPMPTPITQDFPFPPAVPPVVRETPILLTGKVATPTSVILNWSFTQTVGTPDITGFLISLGVSPQTYTRTVNIADKAARSATIEGLNLSTVNYVIIQSYTDLGMFSLPSPELIFGGTPSSPVFTTVTPVMP